MIINKNTTLEELIKFKKDCLAHVEKTLREKNSDEIELWECCEGCQYYEPIESCRILGKMVPCNWLLPDLDYLEEMKVTHEVK